MSDQTPYTPSLDEARGRYVGSRIKDDGSPGVMEAAAEFDRLIAQVRAETLREAADDVPYYPEILEKWLRNRADRIEQGETA